MSYWKNKRRTSNLYRLKYFIESFVTNLGKTCDLDEIKGYE